MKLPIKEYFNLLYKYLNKQKLAVITLLLIIVLNLCLQLINPQILRYFIDASQKQSNGDGLVIAAVLFIGFGVVRQIFKVIATYIGENIGWRATNNLRSDLINHCINLDMDFHKKHQPGEMLERVDGDVNSLFSFFSTFMLKLLSNFGLVIGIIILLFLEDWKIGVTITAFALLDVAVMKVVEKKAAIHWEKDRANNAELYGFLGEQVTSIEDINTCGSKEYTMNCLYKLYKKMLPVNVKASLGYYYMWIVNIVIFGVGNALALLLSAYLYARGDISFGTVYLIFYYTDLIINPLEEIRSELQKLQKAEASIKRVSELFKITSSIKYGDKTITSEAIAIDVENVSFMYENEEKVLKNINFQVSKNKVLGVLGHTGSGKTTLARLITRLYDTCEGCIKFNKEDIKSLTKESLMESISYVTQEVQLFHASVRDNLTLFNSEIEEKFLLDVIEEVGLTPWINSLPKGLDTVIDSGGGGLSAGEAQLLAFVRIFLKNPGLVILDEATSKLDPITEGLVDSALNKLLENRTCIIIAHRLKTVERADEILILEEGQVIEYGNRMALCKDCSSKFSKLLEKGLEEVLV